MRTGLRRSGSTGTPHSPTLRAFEKIVGDLLAEPMCVETYRRIA
jgi:hypothetical protein